MIKNDIKLIKLNKKQDSNSIELTISIKTENKKGKVIYSYFTFKDTFKFLAKSLK